MIYLFTNANISSIFLEFSLSFISLSSTSFYKPLIFSSIYSLVLPIYIPNVFFRVLIDYFSSSYNCCSDFFRSFSSFCSRLLSWLKSYYFCCWFARDKSSFTPSIACFVYKSFFISFISIAFFIPYTKNSLFLYAMSIKLLAFFLMFYSSSILFFKSYFRCYSRYSL